MGHPCKRPAIEQHVHFQGISAEGVAAILAHRDRPCPVPVSTMLALLDAIAPDAARDTPAACPCAIPRGPWTTTLTGDSLVPVTKLCAPPSHPRRVACVRSRMWDCGRK
jgi:hypothetical protein